MKKLLSLLICSVMVLGFAAAGGEGFMQALDAFSVKASAAEYGLLNYMVENGEVQITGADWECAGDIVIPSEIDGYPVSSIGSDAFNSCDGLTSVKISDGIESINDGAFAYCHALTSINIPVSITSIGNGAFAGCSSLTSITIPENVTTIGRSAFAGCTCLTDVNIPYGVGSIGERAFYGCLSLENIVIPDDVETIGAMAFGLTGLKKIVIPKKITDIGEAAFGLCPALEYVHIPSSVKKIGDLLFYYNDANLKGLINEITESGDIPQQVAEKFLSIEHKHNAYICSDTEDCYVKTYAKEYKEKDPYSDEEARVIEFHLCTGHEKYNWDSIKIEVAPEQKADYRSRVIIKATAAGVPEGYYLVMTVDGKEIKGTNTEVTYEIEEITSDVTYSVKVVDESGNVQKDRSGNELKKDGGKIICSDGFFKRLIAFFRAIFKIFSMVEIKP